MTADPNADLVEMLRAAFPRCTKASLGPTVRIGLPTYLSPSELHAILAWANARRDAAVAAERERIIQRVEDEADVMPCAEDAAVVGAVAALIRADFSYEQAEALEVAEDTKDAEIARLRGALEGIRERIASMSSSDGKSAVDMCKTAPNNYGSGFNVGFQLAIEHALGILADNAAFEPQPPEPSQ